MYVKESKIMFYKLKFLLLFMWLNKYFYLIILVYKIIVMKKWVCGYFSIDLL